MIKGLYEEVSKTIDHLKVWVYVVFLSLFLPLMVTMCVSMSTLYYVSRTRRGPQ